MDSSSGQSATQGEGKKEEVTRQGEIPLVKEVALVSLGNNHSKPYLLVSFYSFSVLRSDVVLENSSPPPNTLQSLLLCHINHSPDVTNHSKKQQLHFHCFLGPR